LLGDLDRAIELERAPIPEAVLVVQPDLLDFRASQLARFEKARVERGGPWMENVSEEDRPKVWLDSLSESAATMVHVDAAPSVPEGAAIHAYVTHSGKLAGFIEARLAPPELRPQVVECASAHCARWNEGHEVHLSLVDVGTATTSSSASALEGTLEQPYIRLHPYTDEVRALPEYRP
jgi:hypothetical protein